MKVNSVVLKKTINSVSDCVIIAIYSSVNKYYLDCM